jgi:hypothetical protein
MLIALSRRALDPNGLSPDFVLAAIDSVRRLVPPGPARVQGMGVKANMLSGLGRLKAARPLVDSLARISPEWAQGVELAPVLQGMAPPGAAEKLLAGFERMPPNVLMSLYWQAVVNTSEGNLDAARRAVAKAMAVDSPRGPPLPKALFSALDGWIDVVGGDTLKGLQAMNAAFAEIPYAGPAQNVAGPLRFHHAAALANHPDTREEGLRRLETLITDNEMALTAPVAFVVLGEAYERAGRNDAAARAYATFLRLWEGADPELQPRADNARRALQRLSTDRTR